jgi:hypothetical protein
LGGANGVEDLLTPVAMHLGVPWWPFDAAGVSPSSNDSDDGFVVVVDDVGAIGYGFARFIATDFAHTRRVCVYASSDAEVVRGSIEVRRRHAALYDDLDVLAFAKRQAVIVERLARACVLESRLTTWARGAASRSVTVRGKYVPPLDAHGMLVLYDAIREDRCHASDLPSDADTRARVDRLRRGGRVEDHLDDLKVVFRRVQKCADPGRAAEWHTDLARGAQHIVSEVDGLYARINKRLRQFICARAPSWWSDADRVVPSLEDMRRLLREIPERATRVRANLPTDAQLADFVAPPEHTEAVNARLLAVAKTVAAPRVWTALRAHADVLLTSPTVALDDRLDPAVLTFVESCLRQSACAPVAALLAATWDIGGHAEWNSVCVDLPALHAATKTHTLAAGRARVVALQHVTRVGTPREARLDDGANRVHEVPKWDNARCSAAAVVWCLREVAAVHNVKSAQRRHPLYHILPHYDGVPHRGNVERCRAALRQFVGELKVKIPNGRALPEHARAFDAAARAVFDASHPAVRKTQRFYIFPEVLLRRVFA